MTYGVYSAELQDGRLYVGGTDKLERQRLFREGDADTGLTAIRPESGRRIRRDAGETGQKTGFCGSNRSTASASL